MEHTEEPERAVCPECGRGRLARVVYGKAAFTDELKRALDAGEVVLGGCLRRSARWQCPECDTGYAGLPEP